MKVTTLISLIAAVTLCSASDFKPCSLREFDKGFVCVCNETYCDSLVFARPKSKGQYSLVTSNALGERFVWKQGHFVLRTRHQRPSKRFYSVIRAKREERKIKKELNVFRERRYQTIVGFGGAFTGAVSHLLDLLPKSLRETIYKDYFSQTEGIGYTFMRIPIGGCDFDLQPWAYNEQPTNDPTLTNFTQLDPRDMRKVEQIREIVNLTKNYDIKIMGAAWSPPKWMKTNNQWSGRGSLRSEYYQTWADYHLKYLRLMAAENVSFWGISTGNEPLNGEIAWFFIRFMSLGWTPYNQGKWIGENLGPTLFNSELRHVRIFTGDDQRYSLPWWVQRVEAGSKDALRYLSGIAVHWYWDQFVPARFLDRTHERYPNHILLNTESCVGDKPYEHHGPELGSWSRAEHYALRIIEDLEHWVSGWIDWNLILDRRGGPNYSNNFVESAIIVDSVTNEIYKQPIFYVLAHFSKFIPPGSVRIACKVDSRHVKAVAFHCPDGSISVILYNSANKRINVIYTDDLMQSIRLRLSPKSINTFIHL